MGVNIVVVNVGNTSDGNVDTNVDNRLNVVDVNVGKIIDERERERINTQKEREKMRKTEK